MEEKRLNGIPVSSGLAMGRFYVLNSEEVPIVERSITEEEIPQEINRFEAALIATHKEILDVQKQLSERLGAEHGEIFNAHLMFVEDRALIEEVLKRLYLEKKNVDYIFTSIGQKYVDVFSKMEDSYMRERASDVKDVVRRVMHNLIGKKREDFSHIEDKVIVVSYDLSPSDTALFHTDKIVGFATDVGSRTSHTAIMARSLGIPAIVGMGNMTKEIATGTTGIIDGTRGCLILSPSKETEKEFLRAKVEIEKLQAIIYEVKDLPSETTDGHSVLVGANIETPEDVTSALYHGANAIGLYRTEFFYMNRSSLPTEEEHEAAYSKVGGSIDGQVIIRTYDLGGDKFASHIHMPEEMNPFLGCRGIRFCLSQPDIFKTQIRGILKASAFSKNIKIMFPLVSTVDEVRRAREILEECKRQLSVEGAPYNENIQVGILVETPSAALTADIIAREVDFFSIGTNDLIQYSLAIDRVNQEVAYLYDPFHPAILRLLEHIIASAHENGIPVGVCGETAGNPAFVLFLLGIGVDSLSASSSLIPAVKKVIRSVQFKQTKELAESLLNMNDPEQVRAACYDFLEQAVPELLLREKGVIL